MKNINYTMLVSYILFSIVNMFNYSFYSFDKLNNMEYEYYFTDTSSSSFEMITEYTTTKNISMLINTSDLNKEEYYANSIFSKDFYGFFDFNSEVSVKSISLFEFDNSYQSVQLKFNDNKEEFDRYLDNNNIRYTFNKNEMIYEGNNIINYIYILFVIIILQSTISILNSKYKIFSLKIISGFSKNEIVKAEFLKIIFFNFILLILSTFIIMVYFILFQNISLFLGYLNYFLYSLMPYYVVFIIMLGLFSFSIYKIDFIVFLKNGTYSIALNFLNYTLKGVLAVSFVINLLMSVTYLQAFIKSESVADEWQKIEDYNFIVQTYNMDREFNEDEQRRSEEEFVDFVTNNINDSFFIETTNYKEEDLLRNNVAIVSANFLTVTRNEYNVDSCGDECLNLVLSSEYKDKQKYIENELLSYLERRVTSDYTLNFTYVDNFSVYSYDLEYNIENDNYLSAPILIIENPKIMSSEFYYTISKYYSKSNDVDSEYYAVEKSAKEYYEYFKGVMSSLSIIFIGITLIFAVYVVVYNNYSTKYYIISNLKKISIMRLNGCSSFDIYYIVYSYLIILYLSLASAAYIFVKNDTELYMNYPIYIIAIGLIDILYLTYYVGRVEKKEISSLIKGELL